MSNNILCGPILRSTTTKSICVWIALDSSKKLTLQILDLDKNVVGRSDPAELESSFFQLGTGLYVYLLQARPTNTQGEFDKNSRYRTHKLYHYQLTNETSTIDLEKAGLTYGGHKHPIFHIPEKLTSVLHGSCRKPHGDTSDDCLTVGDDLLSNHHSDIENRPDLLLMTGDQIYADDVEPSLLYVLREQAETLMGRAETLPATNDKDPKQNAITPKTIPLGGRTAELKKHHSGLSSSEKGNHLMSFGEYAAMYIYVFGNAMQWEKPEKCKEIKAKHIPLSETIKWLDYLPSRNSKKWKDYLTNWRIKSRDEIVAEKKLAIEANIDTVNAFSSPVSMLKVRRLLANIPTYMIFDDHDVTDDWNITGHWHDKVRSSPIGRRIVSNSLAAYWAFQGWGNNPDNFDADMTASIIQHLNHSAHDSSCDDHFDLMTWKHRGWGFSIATNPPIIAIDSRTQRQPDNAYYPPQLMDQYALDWLRAEWIKLKTDGKISHDNISNINKDTCPILIATTPVFGFSPVEHFVRLALWLVGHLESWYFVRSVEKSLRLEGFLTSNLINILDAEAWSTNQEGFTAFLNTVSHEMDIEKCVFLSGDVHYSFSIKGFYKSGKSLFGVKKTLDCYQLTSSSLRNKPNKKQQNALNDLERFAEGKTLWQRFKRQFRRLQAIRGWRIDHELLQHEPTDTDTQNKRIIVRCNLGQVLFDDKGQPIKHTLWFSPYNATNAVEYDLKKGREME